MDIPLRILHLEDQPDFAVLVSDFLEKEGLNAEIYPVTDFAGFNTALDTQPFDVILADYSLPTCNGMQALEAARQKCPDVPFLLLSGAIGEHAAVEILRNGATDYVLKNSLERLAPSIRRAVQETRERSRRLDAESDAQVSERQYRLIFNGSPVPMWVSDPKTGAILEVNEAAVRHYGYSREEYPSLTTKDICQPEEIAKLAQYLADAAGKPSGSEFGRAGLCQHRKKDGTFMQVDVTWSTILFEEHDALLTMANDVTDLIRGAEALVKSEGSLAAAQRIARLGSWELDLADAENFDRNPLRLSGESRRIFDLDPSRTPSPSEFFFQKVHSKDRERVTEVMKRAFRSKESFDVEYRVVLSGGAERILKARAKFAVDSNGRPFQMRGIVMDITERKDLEERLRQSQKLEAIGQLAGGVAHDFNNILTVMHGHALLLLGDKALSKSGKESAQRIAQAAERAAGLTRPLLAFSRQQVMQPRHLDLNEVLSGMTLMLGRMLGENIALHPRYWAQPAYAQADAGMFEQVLLNLALNARDAMPKGGELTIEVAVADVGANHLAAHPEARAGKFVRLSVIDNGSGIAPENLRRIFEPFFTTKDADTRTGLGLATVYGIVKQHQGWIEAESEPGHGATFRIYLPMSKEVESAAGKKSTRPTVKGGSETILVVEDEDHVRELVCQLLSGYGYNVLSAETAEEAQEVWRRSKNKIDLLLTDLVLPGTLDGRELAEKLRKTRAKLKVIFASGYSPEVVGKDFVLQRGQRFLQKPYDHQKLAQTVRACLDAS